MKGRVVFLFLVFLSDSLSAQTDTATHLDQLAKEFLSQGMLDSAVNRLDQRAQYFKKQNKIAHYISAYVEIADLFVQVENYQRSLHYLNRIDPANVDLHQPDIRTSLIEWYLYLGYVYEKTGDYLSAKSFYEKAHLDLVKPEDDEPFQLGRYLYQPLGNIYARLGEYEQALLFLEKFKQLSLLSRDNDASAEAYSDLSIVYQSQGYTDRAIDLYKEALELPGISNKSTALLLSNLGSSLLTAGKNREALATSEQAILFFNKTDNQELSLQERHRYQAWTYGVIARVYFDQEDYRRAFQAIDRAIGLATVAYAQSASREVAKLYILKGSILLKNNKADEALREFQIALTHILPHYSIKDPNHNPETKSLFAENAIIEALYGKAQALYLLYLKHNEQETLEKSLATYRLIFEVEDKIAQEYNYQISKLKLLQERNDRSHQAMDICFLLFQHTQDHHYKEIAFHIMERNKANVLLESLSEVRARKSIQVSDELVEQQRSAKKLIAYYQKLLSSRVITKAQDSLWQERLFQEQKVLERVNQQLEEKHPSYFRFVKQEMKQMSLRTVQDSLIKNGEALLEYFFSDHFLYVIKIDKDRVLFEQIEISDKLFQLINDYITRLRQPPIASHQENILTESAYQLYNQLMAPIIKDNTPTHLVIIPDGLLMYLPFETLLTSPSVPGQKSLPYLIQQSAVSYSFSIMVLNHSYQHDTKDNSSKTFIGFAPGFTESKSFNPLFHSRKEVEEIDRILEGDVWKNNRATKASFINQAKQYRVIHLSTHAAVEKNAPLYSWIAFYDDADQPEDSFKLFLSEIYHLELQADLVVLSACETGIGYFSKGEGVMSLARGFAFAGCPSTVTTLWQVNDDATAKINISFYKYLKKGYEKDDALRQAKLDYLSRDDVDPVALHPYYWSSLIIIGDTDSIIMDSGYSISWGLLAGGMIIAIIIFLLLIKRRRRLPSAR